MEKQIGGFTVRAYRNGNKISVSVGGGVPISFDLYEWDELMNLIRDIVNKPIENI